MGDGLPVIDTTRTAPRLPLPPRKPSQVPWMFLIGVAAFCFALGYFAGREHFRWEAQRAASELQKAGTDFMRAMRSR